MSANTEEAREIGSYRTLRRIVGGLGMVFPIVLSLWGFALCGCAAIEPSLSDYYRLRTRDAFVGILFTIALFLFSYRGYERKDEVAGKLACFSALGVALFPVTGAPWEKVVHFSSATALFLVLAYFALFLFTISGGAPTPQKLMRNGVYRACGGTILACILLICLYNVLWRRPSVTAYDPVFWLEAIALWAFGISWFIKGETLLKDVAT